jgi:hypothetical protein
VICGAGRRRICAADLLQMETELQLSAVMEGLASARRLGQALGII